MRNNTILVVDDEAKIVEVIRSYLEKDGYRVISATSGSEALTQFERSSPALVILDLMLPDLSGEDVCSAIRRRSRTPVIMLTAKVDEENVLRGLGLGADDYVTKPFSPRQLVARVAAVLRRAGEEPVPLADELSFNDRELVIDNLRHEVLLDGRSVQLTPNEFKLLITLAKYPTKVFTRDELICLVLGEDFDGLDRAIDSHIKNIRQKIEPEIKKPRYVLTVHGIGYKFGGDAG